MAKAPKQRKRCPVQGKIRFRSRRQALIFAARVATKYRPYECPHCHSWHFTSKYAEGAEEL